MRLRISKDGRAPRAISLKRDQEAAVASLGGAPKRWLSPGTSEILAVREGSGKGIRERAADIWGGKNSIRVPER